MDDHQVNINWLNDCLVNVGAKIGRKNQYHKCYMQAYM